MPGLITFTTDFGSRDAYAGIMKASALQVCPDIRFVDITHNVAPFDVMEAAFHLKSSYAYFPAGTIHVAVVDPGVGSSRTPILVEYDGYTFIGPDNGIFTLVLDGQPPDKAIVLDNPTFWRTEIPSTTFHGRDIFAPVAGHVAMGVETDRMGRRLESLHPLLWALPIADESGIQGWVVHIDRFGNCISNINRDLFDRYAKNRSAKCYVGSGILPDIGLTYTSVKTDEPVALFGSNGYLEVAVNSGNAADALGIQRGQPINMVFS